eukprot:CFRG4372T1
MITRTLCNDDHDVHRAVEGSISEFTSDDILQKSNHNYVGMTEKEVRTQNMSAMHPENLKLSTESSSTDSQIHETKSAHLHSPIRVQRTQLNVQNTGSSFTMPDQDLVTVDIRMGTSLPVHVPIGSSQAEINNLDHPVVKSRGAYVIVHLAIACVTGVILTYVEHGMDTGIVQISFAGAYEISNILSAAALSNVFIAVASRQRIIHLIFKQSHTRCQLLQPNEYAKTVIWMQIPWILTTAILIIMKHRTNVKAYQYADIVTLLVMLIIEISALAYYTYLSRAVSLRFSDWRHNLRLCVSSFVLTVALILVNAIFREKDWVMIIPPYLTNMTVGLYILDAFTVINVVVKRGCELRFNHSCDQVALPSNRAWLGLDI